MVGEIDGDRRSPKKSELELGVAFLAKENARWGYKRIHGELHKLGVGISASTVRAILARQHVPPAPERARRGSTWRQFLAQLVALLPLLGLTLEGAAPFDAKFKPLVKENCVRCHNAKLLSGGLDLERFLLKTQEAALEDRITLQKISTRLKAGSMPPKGAPRPSNYSAGRTSEHYRVSELLPFTRTLVAIGPVSPTSSL